MQTLTPGRAPWAWVCIVLLLCLTAGHSAGADDDSAAAAQAADNASKPVDYTAAIKKFEKLIQGEVDSGLVSGVTVALIDGKRVVWAKGFGMADKRKKRPAGRDTIYRVGSISKLFTATAAMQLAQKGKLDIDKPIGDYDPEFSIVIPFEGVEGITARQIMCHRSGMIRESPVGSYFDNTQPGIAATVHSLAQCALVLPPNTKNKYSNVAPTILGHAIEKISGRDFASYQNEHVLGPLGMTTSTWLMNDKLRPRLSTAYLRVTDGKGGFNEIDAPQFELGTIPAGNLYSTAEDLARFAICLLDNGKLGNGRLLKADTLKEMFTPQFTDDTNNFGLGFFAGHYNRYRTISHMGAVYGFTSAITIIPGQKLGVVVLNNDDINIGPVRKINNTALSLLLAAKAGFKPPAMPKPVKLSKKELAAFAGEYESESFWATLEPTKNGLAANISHQRMTLTPVGPNKFEAYGRIPFELYFEFKRDSAGRVTGFTGLGQTFGRIDPAAVKPIPKAWHAFLGSYGHDFIPIYISQRYGHLYAMAENMYDHRLTPLNRTVFRFPPGMYIDELLMFQPDATGRIHSINFANVIMKARRR